MIVKLIGSAARVTGVEPDVGDQVLTIMASLVGLWGVIFTVAFYVLMLTSLNPAIGSRRWMRMLGKRVDRNLAKLLGTDQSGNIYLRNLELARGLRWIGLKLAFFFPTLVSVLPLVTVLVLFLQAGISALIWPSTASQPMTAEESGELVRAAWATLAVMLGLPISSLALMSLATQLAVYASGNDVRLWQSLRFLISNEVSPSQNWRQRDLRRMRVLRRVQQLAEQELSMVGTRHPAFLGRSVDMSPLIASWLTASIEHSAPRDPLSTGKIREFVVLWTTGDWRPLLAACEVTTSGSLRRQMGFARFLMVSLGIMAVAMLLLVGVLQALKALGVEIGDLGGAATVVTLPILGFIVALGKRVGFNIGEEKVKE